MREFIEAFRDGVIIGGIWAIVWFTVRISCDVREFIRWLREGNR